MHEKTPETTSPRDYIPTPHPAGAWAAVERSGHPVSGASERRIVARYHQREDARQAVRLENARLGKPCGWRVERVDLAVSGRTPLRVLGSTPSNNVVSAPKSDAQPRATGGHAAGPRVIYEACDARIVLDGDMLFVEARREDAMGGSSWVELTDDEVRTSHLEQALIHTTRELIALTSGRTLRAVGS